MPELLPDIEPTVMHLAFFVERTRSSTATLNKMIKTVKAPDPVGTHMLGRAFLSPRSDFFLYVHIDRSENDEDEEKAYYVQLHMHKPHASDLSYPYLKRQSQRTDWAFAQVTGLTKGEGNLLGFFDAEIDIPNVAPPPNFGGIPLAIGNRTLPVKGIEYGAEVEEGNVDRFRWTQHGKGLKVEISYCHEFQPTKLADIWVRESATVRTYVEEALAR